MENKKTVSLVLGSGGARGYAHIGVIKELEAQGFEIKSISGSSMGALIGGLYAAGKLEEYENWVKNFNIIDILKLIDFTFSKDGMINGEKVFSKIEQMIGDVKIEDLNIDFTATATDIQNRKEVWLQKGCLSDALRASIAIPTLFTPKELNGRLLFDGGILNPIPIVPTNSQFSDLVIAVNLNDDFKINKKQKKKIEKEKNRFHQAIIDFFQNNVKKKESLSYFQLINKSIETMQEVISRHQLASHKPDIMINISSQVCEFYDFHKADEIISHGQEVAKKALQKELKE